MRMIGGFLAAVTVPPLGEDDPLPPEDRVVRHSLGLEDLYRVHGPRLLRFFARRADRQDAIDLVQESFVRFASSAACRDRTVECPEAYLNQIATNLLRDRAKLALQRSLSSHVPAEDVPLAGADLLATLEARDKLNRLQNALMRLKPKTREIFLAHRLDGLSYRQIAERSGLSIKGVEWHMTKAIDLLDRALRR
ncbi:RNA polymerase sigma factor [Pseudorhodoplanes sp.]|jgi:RNA polymerase sigma factor (sigma-70 family)|uniref:RNA polymerase sigma factor n=1 Tax=Pseudorhodoplanes sp. TaxID=1934341 RepID=UPI002B5133AF|nr:RNA polymerase sigma factor [Pseudorhodoplanes sp.]HWV54461.1 RNA polymerase sigma factor [Pseudorhodoplanes sp.]